MNQQTGTESERLPEPPLGFAVLKFECGEMRLELHRTNQGFIWFQGQRRFGSESTTVQSALRFLKQVSEIYNYTLVLLDLPPSHESST